jgi:8-oxo-dGTP pyrophosphatase MutT (NUDIX family)/pimeloyl-ACP methyl ester carboxylesterase
MTELATQARRLTVTTGELDFGRPGIILSNALLKNDNKPDAAAFLLIRAHNDKGKWRYLLQKRNDGTWGLPGGGLHPGEDAWDGAVREASEELGDLPENLVPRLTLVSETDDLTVHTFVVDLIAQFTPNGQGSTPEETAGWGWFSKKEVPDLPLHPDFEKTWDAINWGDLGKLTAGDVVKRMPWMPWAGDDITFLPSPLEKRFNPLELRNIRGEWTTANGVPALILGHPKTAKHVVVYVPGVLSTTPDGHQRQIERIHALKDAADKMAQQHGSKADTAFVLWGYKAPKSLESGAIRSYALATAGRLKEYHDKLRAGNPSAHITVIGHSYGSFVAGEAARLHGMRPDDMVFIGSPGVGASNVSALGMPASHVWVGAERRDGVPLVSTKYGLGVNPAHSSFGARVFASNHPQKGEYMVRHAHSSYFRKGSEALPNISAIVNRQYDAVTPPGITPPPIEGNPGMVADPRVPTLADMLDEPIVTSAEMTVEKKFDPLELRNAHGEWERSGEELWKSGEGELKDIKPEEAEAAKRIWYRNEFALTNDYLRKGTKPSENENSWAADEGDDKYDSDIAALKGMMDRAPRFSKPAVLVRGVDTGNEFGLMGSKVGKVFKDKGFMSATTKTDEADIYSSGAIIRLHVPAGGKAFRSEPSFFEEGPTDYAAQHEYTMAPGTRWRVDSDQSEPGDHGFMYRTINATQLNAGEPGPEPEPHMVKLAVNSFGEVFGDGEYAGTIDYTSDGKYSATGKGVSQGGFNSQKEALDFLQQRADAQ